MVLAMRGSDVSSQLGRGIGLGTVTSPRATLRTMRGNSVSLTLR